MLLRYRGVTAEVFYDFDAEEWLIEHAGRRYGGESRQQAINAFQLGVLSGILGIEKGCEKQPPETVGYVPAP